MRTVLLSISILTAATLAGGLAHAQLPEDLLPNIHVTSPPPLVGQTGPVAMPASFDVLFDGADPDGTSGLPTDARYLLVRAVLPDGGYAETRLDVETHVMDFAPFYNEGWSAWTPWNPNPAQRVINVTGLPRLDEQLRLIYYVLVLQTMDELGAVSLTRQYGVNLVHFTVEDSAPRK